MALILGAGDLSLFDTDRGQDFTFSLRFAIRDGSVEAVMCRSRDRRFFWCLTITIRKRHNDHFVGHSGAVHEFLRIEQASAVDFAERFVERRAGWSESIDCGETVDLLRSTRRDAARLPLFQRPETQVPQRHAAYKGIARGFSFPVRRPRTLRSCQKNQHRRHKKKQCDEVVRTLIRRSRC